MTLKEIGERYFKSVFGFSRLRHSLSPDPDPGPASSINTTPPGNDCEFDVEVKTRY